CNRRRRDRTVGLGVERKSTARTEAVIATVDSGAAWTRGNSHFAQHRHRPTVHEHRFQFAQLGVDLAQRRELGKHQWVIALAKAMQVESDPAEVAVGQLARLAQKTRPTTHTSTLAKARDLRGPRLLPSYIHVCHGSHAIRPLRRVSAMRSRHA